MTPNFAISRTAASAIVSTLTPRERQIAEKLAMGETRRRIAKELGISMRTLDHHIDKVRKKLGLGNNVNGLARIWFAALIGE